jgi:hypothetical protein
LQIEKRRTVLQLEARRLGKLLYGEKAKRLRSDLDEPAFLQVETRIPKPAVNPSRLRPRRRPNP